MNNPVMLASIETPRQDAGMSQEDIDKEIDKWIEQYTDDIVLRNHYDSLDALEKDWYLFQSMCYEHKVLSNNVAYRLYGMKNEEIYYKLKRWFITHEEIKDERDNVITYAPRTEPVNEDWEYIDDFEDIDPQDKRAMEMTKDTGYYIITNRNRSPEDLEKQLYKFRSMDHDKKVKADTMSIQIYGKKNEERYSELMPKLLYQQNVDDPDYSNTIYDAHVDYEPLQEEVVLTSKYKPPTSILGLYENMRDYMNRKDVSLTECAILLNTIKDVQPTTILESWYKNFIVGVVITKINDEVKSSNCFLAGYGAPLRVEEMEDLGIFSGENNFFGPGKQNTPSDWFNNYKALSIGLKPKMDICGTDWNNRIRFLANGLENNDQTKQEMLELGCNPEIPFTEQTLQNSIVRNNKFMEQECGYEFIDFHEMVNWMPFDTTEENNISQGIYVIFIHRDDGINELLPPDLPRVFVGFDSTLDKMYSITNGLFSAPTSIKQLVSQFGYTSDIKIKVFFLAFTPKLAEKVNQMMDYYRTHGFDYRFKYSFINSICSQLKVAHPEIAKEKKFCIYLMNMILSIAHMDYRNPGNYMILPTIANLRNDSIAKDHIYEIYFGPALHYNPNQIANLLNFHIDFEPFTEELVALYPYTRILPVLEASTADTIPLELDYDANALVSKGQNFNMTEEVDKTLVILKQYAGLKDMGKVKYYLCRLWYLNDKLETRILYPRKIDKPLMDKYYKLKEKILKNFKKYNDMIVKEEPDFEFKTYYKSTNFYKYMHKAIALQQSQKEYYNHKWASIFSKIGAAIAGKVTGKYNMPTIPDPGWLPGGIYEKYLGKKSKK